MIYKEKERTPAPGKAKTKKIKEKGKLWGGKSTTRTWYRFRIKYYSETRVQHH